MDYIFDEIDTIECYKCGCPAPLILETIIKDDKQIHCWVCSSCGEVISDY